MIGVDVLEIMDALAKVTVMGECAAVKRILRWNHGSVRNVEGTARGPLALHVLRSSQGTARGPLALHVLRSSRRPGLQTGLCFSFPFLGHFKPRMGTDEKERHMA